MYCIFVLHMCLLHRRYFTRWWWVSGTVLVAKDVVAPMSRLVARELIDELAGEEAGVYSGYRLQVGFITVHYIVLHASNASEL
jgi:hypothetical protein